MDERESIGRQPVEYIIIYRDSCSLTYGEGACEAKLGETGSHKCFNTISTCQFKDAYTRNFQKDYFFSPENLSSKPIPGNHIRLPFLRSVSYTPTTINPAGANKNMQPLGKRATISVTLEDANPFDFSQDKYFLERLDGTAQEDSQGYDPDEKGTFFGKYFARNQYLWGRRIEWITGYLDENGDLIDQLIRTFFIDSVSGPDEDGKVSISAKDALMLTNQDKAKAPIPSQGRLDSSISASDTSLTISSQVAGVMDEYASSGKVKIGNELIDYTGKSGNDLTGLTRGILGTESDDHDEGETVQACWEVDSKQPDDIIRELLEDYTNIPATLMATGQWGDEVSNKPWLQHQYSTVISDPTGVDKLLGDIAQQQQFFPWFDDLDNSIKIAAIAPDYDPESLTVDVDDEANIIADSFSTKRLDDQVATRLYTYVEPINWAEDLKDKKNYKTVLIDWDSEEEDDNHRRQSESEEVYGYWLTPTLGALLANNIVRQFSVTPTKETFSLDAKDMGIKTADFIAIYHRLITDEIGERKRRISQIISAKESKKGTTFEYQAVSYFQKRAESETDWLVPIPTSTNNIDLYDLFTSTYPSVDIASIPSSEEIIFYPDSSDIIIGSRTSGLPSLSCGIWPTTLQASLVFDFDFKSGVSNCWIIGKGGNGGGTFATEDPEDLEEAVIPEDGKDGGDAIEASELLKIKGNGTIAGGGGGGGGGWSTITLYGTGLHFVIGGGGGGGSGSDIGVGAGTNTTGDDQSENQREGTKGEDNGPKDLTRSDGGLGAILNYQGDKSQGGDGGDGGGLAQDGKDGELARDQDGDIINEQPAKGGEAGLAVWGYAAVDDSEFTGTYYGDFFA